MKCTIFPIYRPKAVKLSVRSPNTMTLAHFVYFEDFWALYGQFYGFWFIYFEGPNQILIVLLKNIDIWQSYKPNEAREPYGIYGSVIFGHRRQ